MNRMRRLVRIGATAAWLLILSGLCCLVGFSSPADVAERANAAAVEPAEDGGKELVIVEGFVREYDFCCAGFRFGLDDTCQTPVVLYSDVEDFVDKRVRVTGQKVRCGPRPLCVCRLTEDGVKEGPDLSDYDTCLAVLEIVEINACTPPAN